MPPLKLIALLFWYFTTFNDCGYCSRLNYTTVTNNTMLLYTHFAGNPRKRVWVPSRIPSPNDGTCFVTSAVGFHSCIKDVKKKKKTNSEYGIGYLSTFKI